MSRGVLEAVLYNYLIYLYFNQLSFYSTTFYNDWEKNEHFNPMQHLFPLERELYLYL